MFDFIQHYSSNKSKLFDFGIEVLYAFTLLFFAGRLYGEEISIDALVSSAKSVSVNFFQDVIGISLAYFLIAIIAQIAVLLTMLSSAELVKYIGYRHHRKQLKAELKQAFTFEKYKNRQESRIIYNEAAYRMFANLNEKQFVRTRDYYLSNKATVQSSRIFVILVSYLIIDLGFLHNGFGVMNWIIIPGLIAIILFYVYASQLEEAISHPDFFSRLDNQSILRKLRQKICKNKSCFQRISRKEKETIKENVFFVHNKRGRIVGWIIIVDQETIESEFMESIFYSVKAGKGSYKILLDAFDLIPDSFSNQGNLKVIKSVDQFNLDREVNDLLFKTHQLIKNESNSAVK